MQDRKDTGDLSDLVELMRRLRGPGGCPWDREQDAATLRRFVLEEAYEVLQAIDDQDPVALCDELGDLLLQIVFLSQINEEEGEFTIDDVVRRIHEKLVRRHPHVFGDLVVNDAETVSRNWDAIKRDERGGTDSLMAGLPRSLPALARAEKLGRRAAQLEFDWPDVASVLEKVDEEMVELRREVGRGVADDEALAEEVGDLLFTIAHVARHLGISPEIALTSANDKFERRFRELERIVGDTPHGPDELERVWDRVKGS